MNRINQLFQNKKGNILSVYFTAGYPKKEATTEIIRELAQQGADLIEIGLPYSDPLADGPVIQASSQQAINNGMTIPLLFSQLKDIRKEVALPLIIMTYFNPVLVYGFENFCRNCSEAGIDGLIIPDLPFSEYTNHYKSICDKYDLRMVMLITPQTSSDRVHQIDNATDGFIYMVSSASTTGAKAEFNADQISYFHRIKNMNLKNPCLTGFGISNQKTLSSAFTYSNGAIVGSRFIQHLSNCNSYKEAVNALFIDLGIRQ